MRVAAGSAAAACAVAVAAHLVADQRTGRGAAHGAQRGAEQRAAQHAPDRKSTRLNSSHLVISYAVFCLKKKETYPTSRANHCHRTDQWLSLRNYESTYFHTS